MKTLIVLDLGMTKYMDVYRLQKELVVLRMDDKIPDMLILTEHEPVYTFGRAGKEENLLRDDLGSKNGVELIRVDRGGDITFHGPGQAVIYPIFNLAIHKKDLLHFIRKLEEAVIKCLDACGAYGRRKKGYTGVWIDDERKIASIGLGFSHWVSYHGIGLNIQTDLDFFKAIVPCGIKNIEMTNLINEIRDISPGNGLINICKDNISRAFAKEFDFKTIYYIDDFRKATRETKQADNICDYLQKVCHNCQDCV